VKASDKAIQDYRGSRLQILYRSFYGAVFLSVVAGLLLASQGISIGAGISGRAYLSAACFIPACLIVHLIYELVLPAHQRLSAPRVLEGFREVTAGNSNAADFDYTKLRVWRQQFLASAASDQKKLDVIGNLHRRQLLTYTFAGTLASLLFSLGFWVAFPSATRQALFATGISAFFALCIARAHCTRSVILGRYCGYAFLGTKTKQKNDA
jgi:hypothetical protein